MRNGQNCTAFQWTSVTHSAQNSCDRVVSSMVPFIVFRAVRLGHRVLSHIAIGVHIPYKFHRSVCTRSCACSLRNQLIITVQASRWVELRLFITFFFSICYFSCNYKREAKLMTIFIVWFFFSLYNEPLEWITWQASYVDHTTSTTIISHMEMYVCSERLAHINLTHFFDCLCNIPSGYPYSSWPVCVCAYTVCTNHAVNGFYFFKIVGTRCYCSVSTFTIFCHFHSDDEIHYHFVHIIRVSRVHHNLTKNQQHGRNNRICFRIHLATCWQQIGRNAHGSERLDFQQKLLIFLDVFISIA